MGNSCCSNEGRKGNDDLKKEQIEQYIIDHLEDANKFDKNRKLRFSQQKGLNMSSSDESQYTLNELLNKEKKKNVSPQTMTSSSHSSKSLSSGGMKVSNEKMQRLNLLREKQQQLTGRKFVDENFDGNAFSKQKQFTIIKTIKALAQGQDDLQLLNIQRYDFQEIRRFLNVSNWNYQIAARKISQDIQWRSKHIPVKTLQILNLLKTQNILFQGCDRDLCPCIILKPNYKQQRAGLGQIQSNSQFIREYTMLFTFAIENLLPQLVTHDRMTPKISFLIDLENREFRIDIIEAIEELILYHYPGRLNHIYIININLELISNQIGARFSQNFYKKNVLLFDANYQINLLKFFDPQELLKEYGGQVVIKAHYNNINENKNLEDYMLNEFRMIYPVNSISGPGFGQLGNNN